MIEVLMAATLSVSAWQEPPTVMRSETGWTAMVRTSEFDGETTYLAYKNSTGPVRGGLGQTKLPSLNISCIDSDLQVSLDWPNFLGRDQLFVFASVDRGRIHEWTWYLPRPGGTAVFAGSGNWRRFSNAIADGERITFQVHAFRGVQEATFDLAGISDVMEQAVATCEA